MHHNQDVNARFFMRLKLICCEVFMREMCLAIAKTENIVDPEFTPKDAHEKPDYLRRLIQNGIDAVSVSEGYDAVLLGFGLCGNSTAGIKARSIPLVIPRAHDCCTIFLGGKQKFVEYFKDNLSAEWSSAGYMERGDSYLRDTDTGKLLGLDKDYQQLIDKYGDENAKYIWETLHPTPNTNQAIYIEVPELAHLGYLDRIKSLAKKQGKTVRVLEGDMRLIKNLVGGNWNKDEFLVVPPGKEITAVYDQEEILSLK
jgi:hypothetical protein